MKFASVAGRALASRALIKMVTVCTEDGKRIPIPDELLPQLTLLNGAKSVEDPDNAIPLPKVSSGTLSKILEYARLHLDDPLVTASIRADPATSASPDTAPIKLSLSMPRTVDGEEDEDVVGSDGDAEHGVDGDDDVSAYLLEERADDLICPGDKRFTASLDVPALLDLTMAANYLAMEALLDLCCKTLAGLMTGLSTAELRQRFHIQSDFTPEEEARLQAEYGWADE